MVTTKDGSTTLTEENYEVLIAILEEMRNCLNADMNIEELSDRASRLPWSPSATAARAGPVVKARSDGKN